MVTKVWTGAVDSTWENPGNWSPPGVPGSDDVIISGGNLTLTTSIPVASLTTSNNTYFPINDPNGTVTVAGDVTNSANLQFGSNGGAGSTFSVGGTLTNSASGYFQIGSSFSNLTGPMAVTVGALSNSGTIAIYGNAGTTSPQLQASLLINGAAPAQFGGILNLYGDALVRYTSGSITSIGPTGVLSINGPDARFANAGDTTSNSALTQLSVINAPTVSTDHSLDLVNGATASLSGDLANAGIVRLDPVYASTGGGGSSLSINGTLTNTGTFQIGIGGLTIDSTATVGNLVNTGTLNLEGGATGRATLIDKSAAPTSLTGVNTVTGDALLDYASGAITSIADGAQLSLVGPKAFVADASDVTSNSALTELSSVGKLAPFSDHSLSLTNGAVLNLTGDLANNGVIDVDPTYASVPGGGSSLSVAGTLTNAAGATLQVGIGGLASNSTVTVGNFDNNGTVNLAGGALPGETGQAQLIDKSAAPATLTGFNNLSGSALLEYGSGNITSIANGAELSITGPSAFIADAAAPTSNSALTQLSSIGTVSQQSPFSLSLTNGAVLDLTGDLANNGVIDVDPTYPSVPGGGSSLSVAGTLTNATGATLQVGIGGLASNSTVTVGNIVNNGTVNLAGGTLAGQNGQAQLIDKSAAPGTLTGFNNLSGDSLLQFASGSVTALGNGAELSLTGPNAFVANAANPTSNSALTDLSSIGTVSPQSPFSLALTNGVALSLAGSLTNAGVVQLDQVYPSTGGGGSSLTIAGPLTNTTSGVLDIGTTGLTSASIVETGGLSNAGTVNVAGSGTASGVLGVLGPAANTGTLNVAANGIAEVTGAFTDSGQLTDAGLLVLGSGLEVSNGATLSIQGGQILSVGSGSVTLDPGSTLTGSGTIYMPVVNAGTITASGGALNIQGDVSGTGGLAIGAGAVLEIKDASSEPVSFGGNVGTLKLDEPASFTGSISGLVAGDTIDLAGVQATAAAVSGPTLTVTTTAGTITYQVSGPGLSGNVFAIENDLQGGTELVLGTPGPVIAGPSSQTVFTGLAAVLGPLTIADPTTGASSVTVTVKDALGALSATGTGSATVTGNGSHQLTITGNLADVDTVLAGLEYLRNL